MTGSAVAASRGTIDLDTASLLWRRVLEQAFMDATYPRPSASFKEGGQGARPAVTEQRQARAWLTGYSPDFALVCDFAGLDARIVRRRARELRQDGWPVHDFPDRGAAKLAQLARARESRCSNLEAA